MPRAQFLNIPLQRKTIHKSFPENNSTLIFPRAQLYNNLPHAYQPGQHELSPALQVKKIPVTPNLVTLGHFEASMFSALVNKNVFGSLFNVKLIKYIDIKQIYQFV